MRTCARAAACSGKDNGCIGNHFVTNDIALTLAVRCNRLDMVEALLRAGVGPDQDATVDGVEHVSALMVAAKTGSFLRETRSGT